MGFSFSKLNLHPLALLYIPPPPSRPSLPPPPTPRPPRNQQQPSEPSPLPPPRTAFPYSPRPTPTPYYHFPPPPRQPPAYPPYGPPPPRQPPAYPPYAPPPPVGTYSYPAPYGFHTPDSPTPDSPTPDSPTPDSPLVSAIFSFLVNWRPQLAPFIDHNSAKKIKNDVNVHQNTITLHLDDQSPDSHLLSFTFDADVDGIITVYYLAKEGSDCTFTPIHPEIYVPQRIAFQKGLGQKFCQPSGSGIGLGLFDVNELSKPSQNEQVFPLVIVAETSAPSLTDAQPDQYVSPPHAQITEAVLVKGDEGNFQVRVIKQILWIEGVRYELREIFGISNPGTDCVICLIEPKSTTILPCRHMCLCSKCAIELSSHESEKCPICRQPIEELLQIKADNSPFVGYYYNNRWFPLDVYVVETSDAGPPPPFIDHKSLKNIQCDVNVRKDTITLHSDDQSPNSHLLSFTFDAEVNGSITVYYLAKEGSGCTFSPIHPEIYAPHRIEFHEGLGQNFFQPSGSGIDLGLFDVDELSKPSPNEEIFPLVIVAETRAPSPTDAQPYYYVSPPHSQITEAVLVKGDEGNLQVKVIKQILWIEGVRYELREIIDAGDGKECVICLTEPRDTAISPCRHMCLCWKCAILLSIREPVKCPICRQPVEKLLQIKWATHGSP